MITSSELSTTVVERVAGGIERAHLRVIQHASVIVHGGVPPPMLLPEDFFHRGIDLLSFQ